jgi:hypothetical protein
VAIDGNYAVVGVPGDSTAGPKSGIVKVFDSKSGALRVVLPNPTPLATDHFGSSVAVSGKSVVVGCNRYGSTSVNVYVYDLGNANPTVPVAILKNPSPTEQADFGFSVAVLGTRIVVGATPKRKAKITGSVYLYDLSNEKPNVPAATLKNPSPTSYGNFGCSVAISGKLVVVGNSSDPVSDGVMEDKGGSAYVYDYGKGNPLVPSIKLRSPVMKRGGEQDWFGKSVAIDGTRVVVGAERALVNNQEFDSGGNVFVYDMKSGTPAVPVTTLKAPNGMGGNFGDSVLISGTRVIILDLGGEEGKGSIFLFDLAGARPTNPIALLKGSRVSNSWETYRSGPFAAISGTRLLVGDHRAASKEGNAYLYEISDGRLIKQTATLDNSKAIGK